MNQRPLHTLLAEVHAELLAAQSVDAGDRELLEHLAQDIRSLLETPPTAISTGQYQSLPPRLREAVRAFEASHPQLTRTMENLIDTLSLYNL